MNHALNTEPLPISLRRLAPLGLALFFFGTLAYRYRFFVTDDAYVVFRIARNLVQHHVLAFNLTEGIAAHAHLGGVFLSALMIKAGIEPLGAMRILNLAVATGVLALLSFGLTGPTRQKDTKRLGQCPYAAIILAVSHPFAVWSMGGTDVVLFSALLLLAVLLTARAARELPRASVTWLLPLLPLAFLNRIEAIGPLLIAMLVAASPRRPRLSKSIVVPIAAGMAGWVLLVLGLLSLSALLTHSSGQGSLASICGATPLGLLLGLRDLAETLIGAPLLVFALGVLATVDSIGRLHKGVERGEDLVIVLAAATCIMHLTFVILFGEDTAPGRRLLVPILPLLALMAGRFLERFPAFVAWVLLGFLILAAPFEARQERTNGYPALEWMRRSAQHRDILWRQVDIGRDVRALTGGKGLLALGEPGPIPFEAGNPTLIFSGRWYPLSSSELLTHPGLPRSDLPATASFETSAVLERQPAYVLLAAVDDAEGLRGIWAPDHALLHSAPFHAQYVECFRWPRHFPAANLTSQAGHVILYQRRDDKDSPA